MASSFYRLIINLLLVLQAKKEGKGKSLITVVCVGLFSQSKELIKNINQASRNLSIQSNKIYI